MKHQQNTQKTQDRHSQTSKSSNSVYLRHFILSSLIHAIISLLCVYFVPKYGHQSQLMGNYPYKDSAWKFLVNFDGYHYVVNNYTHLPNFAFLPGFTYIAKIVFAYLPYAAVCMSIINKIFFWLSIQSLHQICMNLNLSHKPTHNCILIYIYNPVAVFFHSVYSEPIYAALTFKYVSLQTDPLNRGNTKIIVSSTLLLILAMLIRSTALFLLPVIGIPILLNLYKSLLNKSIKSVVSSLGVGGVILLSTVSVFLLYLYWAYHRVCTSLRPLPECSSSIFVNIYSYVQTHFWNVGLFTYFKLSNLVFILIGLPSIIFSLFFLTNSIPTDTGLQLSFFILLLITISMTNLQSSTRFLCTHPAFYINACLFFYDQGSSKLKNILRPIFKIWQLCYFYVGIVLFALQFPWT